MRDPLKLSPDERAALEDLRKRLEREGGLRISDEKLLFVILKVAAQLPHEDLARLIKEGLADMSPDKNPKNQ